MANVLGTIGIADKGTYDASTKYSYMNEVYYNGSSYICINTKGCTGITPSDDKTNWRFHARGLTDAEKATLTPATKYKLGMVKAGEGINIDADGALSVQKILTVADLAGVTLSDSGEVVES